nr:MAG TPA: hypothetical protein [Caudoviricetes sp.]
MRYTYTARTPYFIVILWCPRNGIFSCYFLYPIMIWNFSCNFF